MEPPRFMDDTLSDIQLLDPSYPKREVYFLMVGNLEGNLTEFLDIKIIDNTQTAHAEISFERNNKNKLDHFQLIMCWSFGEFENLQDFCDYEVNYFVINGQGNCFVGFSVDIDESLATPLQEEIWTFLLDDQPSALVDLAEIISLAHDPELGCGILNFKLANQNQDTLVKLDPDGLLTVNNVYNKAWVGFHTVTFAGFMPELDPEGLHTKPIDDFSIKIFIQDPANLLDPDFAAQLQSSSREAPVAISDTDSIFEGKFNSTETFTLNFANPLVLQDEESELELKELQIKVISNELVPIVSLDNIDYSEGLGYGSIDLIIDGNVAFAIYAKNSASDAKT